VWNSECLTTTLIDAMMTIMRTTVRIDDDVIQELKERAREEKISLTRVLNKTLKNGLRTEEKKTPRKKRFRQKSYDMGVPRVDLTKALALAGELEDQEIARKMALRK